MKDPRDFDLEPPTALEQLASELNHAGKSQYTGVLFATSCRLEPSLFAMVEAMTHHAGTSRNKIMNQLIQVGIQETLGALSDELSQELLLKAGEIEYTAIEKGNFERGEV